MFINIIPENRLYDTWVLARDTHEKNSYPLNAWDFKDAWIKLQDAEELKKNQKMRESIAQCPDCQGLGYIEIDPMNSRICTHTGC